MTGVDKEGNLYCDGTPIKRYYLFEEVAEIVCFMLSDASNLLNGQISMQ